MPQKLLTRLKYAQPKDAHVLSELFSTSWRGAYRGIIPHKQLEAIINYRNTKWWAKTLAGTHNLIIITFDETVIGYANFGQLRNLPPVNLHIPPGNHTGEIMELYLSPDYQGLGFGRQLFIAACTELRKRKMQKLLVWALSKNNIACDFYTQLGGKKCAQTEERFGTAMLKKTGFLWTF